MEVSIRKILPFLKTGNKSPCERTSAMINEMISEFNANINPKSVYKVFDCKVSLTDVEFNSLTINSKNLAKHLANCRSIALFAATLGTAADTIIRKYSVQDMEKALIAQAVSSAMIETYCDETEKEIAKINELKDLHPVSRFSPGYGDFDIAFQKDFLKLLNGSRIALFLTDAFMLTPAKSVTAVIGFTEEKRQITGKCVLCEDKGCSFREAI